MHQNWLFRFIQYLATESFKATKLQHKNNIGISNINTLIEKVRDIDTGEIYHRYSNLANQKLIPTYGVAIMRVQYTTTSSPMTFCQMKTMVTFLVV